MEGNDRSITRFTMAGHGLLHGYELTIPLFVTVWLAEFDVSAAVLGTVVAVGYGLIGVGAVPSGILADRFSAKLLVVASILGMGGGFLALSVTNGVWAITVALLVWGAAASLYHPAALSLITRGTNRTGTALAYHGAAGNVGTAAVPLLAALMLAVLEWQLVAAALAIPALVTAVVATTIQFDETAGVDDGRETREDPGSAKTDGGIPDDDASPFHAFVGRSRRLFASAFAVVFLIALLAGIFYRGVFTFLPEVLGDLLAVDAWIVGDTEFDPSQYLYAGLLMLGALGQLAGGKLSDRITPEYAVVGAFGAQLLVALAFVPAARLGTGAFLLACAALGVFVYLYAPIVQALVGRTAPADVHGLSFGFLYLGTFGIGAAGASIAGIALAAGGVEFVFAVLAIFPAAALALAIVLSVRRRGSTENSPAE